MTWLNGTRHSHTKCLDDATDAQRTMFGSLWISNPHKVAYYWPPLYGSESCMGYAYCTGCLVVDIGPVGKIQRTRDPGRSFPSMICNM